MDVPQLQRTRNHSDPNHDYLTNLPPYIKDIIFMKLPIKEVVRTSILSTKWIDSWVSIPNLLFEQDHHTESKVFTKMVDMVLLGHQGPIQQFKLWTFTVSNEAISRWLPILSRNGIKDLQLFSYGNVILKIPFRLIYCIVLERLCLTICKIYIPASFQGFKQLRTLILNNCNLSGISLEKMISSCPLLDHLKLQFLYQGCLRICASNLTCLEIDDCFHDILLETPKLVSACISHIPKSRNNDEFVGIRGRMRSNIVRTLGRLSIIQKLQIGGIFIQYLAIGALPENFPVVFNHLRDISLDLYIKRNEISTALFLFENAPNLEELYIQFLYTDEPNVDASWESRAVQDHLFRHLKFVRIMSLYDSTISLQFTKSVLEFARLVLTTAPVLETLKIDGLEDAVAIFEVLKWLPKLSKNAEIALS